MGVLGLKRKAEAQDSKQKLDAKARRVVESLEAARKKSGRTKGRRGEPPPRSEVDAAGARVAIWADETRKRLNRSGRKVSSHELVPGASEQDFRKMARKKPLLYWGTPTDKAVVKAADTWFRRR